MPKDRYSTTAISSRPLSDEGRDSWDKIFGTINEPVDMRGSLTCAFEPKMAPVSCDICLYIECSHHPDFESSNSDY